MNIKQLLRGAALLATAAFSASANANLVVNGGFETDVVNGPWTQQSNITGWSSNQIFELQRGSNAGGWSSFNTSYEGNQYLELNSTTLANVFQTLSTTAGQRYNLSFAYSGRPDTPGGAVSSMDVYWNGALLSPTVSAGANSGWLIFTFDNLLATSANTVLSFNSTGPNSASSYGSYLDAVDVEAAHRLGNPRNEVPEPESLATMLLGLGLIGLVMRRRAQKQA